MSMQPLAKRAESLHVPVLLQEVLDVFKQRPIETFIDGTLGLGGHSSALLSQHNTSMRFLLGIDQDTNALELASARLDPHRTVTRLAFAHGNFGDMQRLANAHGIQLGTVDGILLDIGTSSMQLDEARRGFSFMRDGPLDMRMDPSAALTAADIVNDWSEEDIAKARVQPPFSRPPPCLNAGRRAKRRFCAAFSSLRDCGGADFRITILQHQRIALQPQQLRQQQQQQQQQQQ